MRSLGILNRHNDDYHRFYPHSIGHYLGMDVHDTQSFSSHEKLRAGNYVTIEPGLYIPECPHIDPKYHNIGIRIEDDVLIRDGAPLVITRNIPKEVDEIEAAILSKSPLA